MAVRKSNPTTNGQRFRSVASFDEVTTRTPEKSLLETKKKTGGRNSYGRITVRHIGGGNRQKYRVIDFKRNKDNIPAKVASIEYDPNRSAYIALLNYVDGEKRYILAPIGLAVGDMVESGENAEIKVGNTLPLTKIPVGSVIHNIEFNPGKGGKIARSAGISAQFMALENGYATLRMPSGEMRKVPEACRATIGQVGNIEHEITKDGKAGVKRHRGVRPHVRGSAMNPVDHPHGGGEGRAPIGHAGPMTPWGKPALGYKTRKKKNRTNKLMVKRIN